MSYCIKCEIKIASNTTVNFTKLFLEEQLENYKKGCGDVFDKNMFHCSPDSYKYDFLTYSRWMAVLCTENQVNNYAPEWYDKTYDLCIERLYEEIVKDFKYSKYSLFNKNRKLEEKFFERFLEKYKDRLKINKKNKKYPTIKSCFNFGTIEQNIKMD